jgi:hypothetical protein
MVRAAMGITMALGLLTGFAGEVRAQARAGSAVISVSAVVVAAPRPDTVAVATSAAAREVVPPPAPVIASPIAQPVPAHPARRADERRVTLAWTGT